MTDKFSLSLGQAQQLEFALQRNGWTTEQVHELCKGEVLGQIRKNLFPAWKDELVMEVFDLKNLKALGFKRGINLSWVFGGWSKYCTATLGDLVEKTEGDLLREPEVGKVSVEKINKVLESRGLHLGMKIPFASTTL